MGLLLTLGLSANVKGNELVSSSKIKNVIIKPLIITQITLNYTLPDGVYLYGESPQVDKIGQTYLVIEAKKGKILGAFYLPYSEFNCVYGQVEDKKLKLTVIDNYDNTSHLVSILIEKRNGGKLSSNNQELPSLIQLSGLYQIKSLSDNDYRILKSCKTP